MEDDTIKPINPIERMRRVMEEFGVSREAMDMYNAGPLMDYEIIVGISLGRDGLCLPCARETLGDAKVDWILAQRTHDMTDDSGQTFYSVIWEPSDPIVDCERCGRPLKPGEPTDRGAPVGVTQDYPEYASYCVAHAPLILGVDLAAKILTPDYAGLAHIRDDQGRKTRIEFANGGETWGRVCAVCNEPLAPAPEDEDEDDDDEL